MSDYGAGRTFALGDRVRKTRGSSWQGRVVGTYSTALTPEGYCVESEREPGSVQLYPVTALEHALRALPQGEPEAAVAGDLVKALTEARSLLVNEGYLPKGLVNIDAALASYTALNGGSDVKG